MVRAPVKFDASMVISPLTSSGLFILVSSKVLFLRVCVFNSVTKIFVAPPLFNGAVTALFGKPKAYVWLSSMLDRSNCIFLPSPSFTSVSQKTAPLNSLFSIVCDDASPTTLMLRSGNTTVLFKVS